MGILGLIVLVWFVALVVSMAGFVEAVHDIREQRELGRAVPQRHHRPLDRLHLRHHHAV